MGSIIYNIGLQGLKSSDFYQSFRKRDYEVSFTELLLLKSRDRGVRARRLKELGILLRNYDAERKKFNMVRH
jgi:GH24 family phage-related lysozyme (muramidase)